MAVKKVITFKLKLKDEGKDVLLVQQMLAKLGSKIKETGVYTIGMMSAVRSFQKKNGLKVTGVVDQKTWDALKALTPSKKTGGRKK